MDNIDLCIAMDCYEDMELVRHDLVKLSRRKALSIEAAFDDLLNRVALLQREIPIGFFVSETPYGPLSLLGSGLPRLQDVITADGLVAGPPFVHLSRTDWPERALEEQFHRFFTKYGVPRTDV